MATRLLVHRLAAAKGECAGLAAAWPLGFRRFATDDTAALVERTLVVDTLGMVRKREQKRKKRACVGLCKQTLAHAQHTMPKPIPTHS